MAVLLLAEVNDGELAMDATAKAVTACADLGDVTVLCTGATCAAAATEAATVVHAGASGTSPRVRSIR